MFSGHHNSSASDYGSGGGSSGHVTPQHLVSNNQQSHVNHAMGPETGSSIGSTRDAYQRPYQSASGSSADYSSAGGNLDVSNKKMAR